MKKKLLLKTMLLLCALVAGSSSVWADEVVFDATTDVTSNVSAYKETDQIYTAQDGLEWIANGFGATANQCLTLGKGNANYLKTPIVAGKITSIKINAKSANSYYLKIVDNNGSEVVAQQQFTSSYSEKTFTVTGDYSQLKIFAKRYSSTSNAAVDIKKVTVTYTPGSTDPAISLSVNSLDFGEVEATGSKQMTFTVTPSHLTAGLTLSTNNDKYIVSPTSIAATATGAQTITVTAKPTSVSVDMTGKVTISGDDFTDDTEVSLTTTVIRKDANLSFDPTSVELTQGAAFTAPTFKNPNNLTNITFTSTYKDVATVTNEGVISLGENTGTAVIRATSAQTDVYTAGEATCTITVNPAGVTPEPSADSYYVKVTSTDDLEDGDYLIVYETGKVALNGNLPSSGVDVASNTIGFTFDNDNNIVATNNTEAAEFEIEAMDGGYSVMSKSKSYYLTHISSGNVLDTSTEATANEISFSNGNAVIKVGTYNIRYNSSSGQERFRYYTTTANVQLYKKVAGQSPSSIEVYVSAAGFATYASNFDLDYEGSGLVAYKAVEDNGDIKFEEVTKVPAGAGVLLRASDGGGQNYAVSTTTSSETENMEGNKFVRGTDAAVASNDGEGNYNYILNVVNNEIGFYRAAGNTVATNRAYIHTTINPTSGAIQFNFDEATGIRSVDNGQLTMDNEIYNLNGQRVAQPIKGLYILNGKKVIIK